MSFGSARAKILLVVWLLLIGAAVAVGIGHEQSDLENKAQQALIDAGITAGVTVSGRDVTLTGSPEYQQRATELVAAIDGVRAVNWELDTTEATASTTTTSPPPTSSSSPTTAGTTSTLPPISDDESTAGAYLDARLENGQLTMHGTLPDAEAAARLESVADLIYSPLLDNEVVVDPNVATASWVAHAADIVAVLPIIGTSGITVNGEQATVFGYAPHQERLAELEGALTQALGPDVTLTSQVVITNLQPPSINAEVAGDGILQLSGTVPNRGVASFAHNLAVQSYGEENVIDEIEVDPTVDTTFSLFRLPLVFSAFTPFPEWHVEIYDNVISGQLLNGASFPSGSAELTPQLKQLMPIGVAILTRNPSLVLTVEGHTDDIGSVESNQALSEARAEAARQWFIAAGISPDRVFAVGYGESRPIADNSTEQGRAMNRRIEFRLGPPE